jgi:hypothetical protein
MKKNQLKAFGALLMVVATSALVLLSLAAYAQSDKYVQAMQKNLALLDSARTTENLITVSSAFERIGDVEKTQWLPYYYAGLALSNVGWMDQKVDKDKNAERIMALCSKAEAIEKNAEIYALKNMAATQQMLVNPQERWQTNGREAATALQQGMLSDPNNPRLHYLQAMSLMNTPESFGGGKAKAKPVFEKSLALFKSESSKPLYPRWGQKQAEEGLANCR